MAPMMRGYLRDAALLLATGLCIAAGSARSEDLCPKTKDRISSEAMVKLVAQPLNSLRSGDLAKAEAELEALLKSRDGPSPAARLAYADTLSAFGTSLWSENSVESDYGERGLTYLKRAIEAYEALYGRGHPETLLAITDYADAAWHLDEDAPSQETLALTAEVHRRSVTALGAINVETVSRLYMLADMKGRPAVTQGDPARIDASAALFEQAISHQERLPCPDEFGGSIVSDYARMLIRNGRYDDAFARTKALLPRLQKWQRVSTVSAVARTLEEQGLHAEAEQMLRLLPQEASDQRFDAASADRR